MPSPQQSLPLTSIVIVTYNRIADICCCLESIQANTPEPHEFVFVDNASSDGTAEYLRERFGAEAVIANERNEGFLRAANRGMAAARGRYIVLLNNDTMVTSGWLAGLQRAAERSREVGITSGKIASPDGRIQLAGAYIAFDGSARMLGEGLALDDPSLAREREVCYVGGHCMLIKREVVEAIGFLDEAYGFGYHEDTDYCYRARRAGFRVVYTPDCLIHHQLFGTPLPERQRIIAENQRLFLERWGEELFLKRSIRPRVEFRADALELPVGAGWYAAEPEYTCTAREAWCYLAPPAGEPGVLEVVASAPHPNLADQPISVEVLAAGQLVGRAFFSTPWEVRQLVFPLPEKLPNPFRVDLRVDRTWSPDDLFADGRDPRAIGLAVRRLSTGTVLEATEWAKEGVPADVTVQRLKEHLAYLQAAIADKDAFCAREMESRQQLVEQLQRTLEGYHASVPFRTYFALKRLLGGR